MKNELSAGIAQQHANSVLGPFLRAWLPPAISVMSGSVLATIEQLMGTFALNVPILFARTMDARSAMMSGPALATRMKRVAVIRYLVVHIFHHASMIEMSCSVKFIESAVWLGPKQSVRIM
jgi:hypothetical protein